MDLITVLPCAIAPFNLEQKQEGMGDFITSRTTLFIFCFAYSWTEWLREEQLLLW